MLYQCMKTFTIPTNSRDMLVRKESVWKQNYQDKSFEIVLENLEEEEWIGITKDMVTQYFKKIQLTDLKKTPSFFTLSNLLRLLVSFSMGVIPMFLLLWYKIILPSRQKFVESNLSNDVIIRSREVLLDYHFVFVYLVSILIFALAFYLLSLMLGDILYSLLRKIVVRIKKWKSFS